MDDDFSQHKSRSKSETSVRSVPDHRPSLTIYAASVTFVACVGGLLFGFDTGIMSGVQLFVYKAEGFTTSSSITRGAVVAVTPAIAAIGAAIAGQCSDRFGRRLVVILSSLLFIAGSVVCAVATSVGYLIAGRGILGLAVGIASMTVPVYISEGAPQHLRGFLVTAYQLMIASGFVLANAVAGAFAHIDPIRIGWRLMFGFGVIPAILQFLGLLCMKESPRYLVEKDREEEAEGVLRKIYKDDEDWVKHDLDCIKDAVDKEREIATRNEGGKSVIGRICATSHVRRALAIGCSMQMFQQLVGINAIMYFMSNIIKSSGITDDILNLWIACGISAVQVVGTLIPMKLVERCGRRPLLLISTGALVVSLFVMGGAFQLITLTAPSINQTLSHSNSSINSTKTVNWNTCVQFDSCDSCVRNEHCGLCYSQARDNAYCLPVGRSEAYSATGMCTKDSEDHSYSMHSISCPSSFKWLVIGDMGFYLIAFAFGMGALPWVYNAEMYPMWARSTCVSMSTFTNWAFNVAVSFSFDYLSVKLSSSIIFFIYGGITAIAFLVFFFFIPETTGLSIEEIEHLFKKDRREDNEEGEESSTADH